MLRFNKTLDELHLDDNEIGDASALGTAFKARRNKRRTVIYL
jgi:hypothetical protein